MFITEDRPTNDRVEAADLLPDTVALLDRLGDVFRAVFNLAQGYIVGAVEGDRGGLAHRPVPRL